MHTPPLVYIVLNTALKWRNGCSRLALLLAVATLPLMSASAAPSFTVKALLKDKAVIEVEGQQKMLRAGGSHAGITLLSADSKAAVIEVDGVRKTVGVGRQMGAAYAEPERLSVRVPSQGGGHFFTSGTINNRRAEFMVDTGATTVAMSSQAAVALGIDYRSGKPHRVQTASGVVTAYYVVLDSVGVENLLLYEVAASVLEGQYPSQILLGNSFLSRVNMNVDNGVLVLESKY